MDLYRCLTTLVFFTAVSGMPAVSAAQQPDRAAPNVVLIVADYMGYSDTEPYGATDVRTPYLKRLAAEGIGLRMPMPRRPSVYPRARRC
jgi:hypothetical protein